MRETTEQYRKVDEALSRGQLWRAKEILRGRISGPGYDSALYERYGSVLLEAGDLFEAGKYLFLSGARNPRYAPAIDLFASRYVGRPKELFSALPRSAQFAQEDAWPNSVAAEMLAMGAILKRLLRVRRKPEKPPSKLAQVLMATVGIGIFLLFIFGVFTGCQRLEAIISGRGF